MIVDEREIERVLRRLERIRSAVIDASSIIYIDKSGFLDLLTGTIRLLTVTQVFAETGRSYSGIELVEAPADDGSSRTDTDHLLFSTARCLGRPLISEDRAILQRCRSEGQEYYNAYMMLIMLTARRVVGEISLYQAPLLHAAHYGRPVIEYADSFICYLSKVL